MASPLIGIVGGGVGGLCAAIALRQLGHEVVVFEQASRFGRVGADINLTPNAVKALDGLGLGDALRADAARPTFRISRMWDTGVETSRLAMSDAAERRYGSPQLTFHRADLLAALEGALPADVLQFGQRVTEIHCGSVEQAGALHFDDGTSADVDVLVGADGIHSVVRTTLFGPDRPQFTGVVAYRGVVPIDRLGVPNLDAFTKWWGPNPETQLVTFPLSKGQEIFVFATRPQLTWSEESWTTPGDVEELRAAYADFHPEARALLDACEDVMKSALYIRDPLPLWSSGRAALLGDACHPMMPFMAQGAGMAIEDAVVLARSLAKLASDDDLSNTAKAFSAYQAARLARTSRVQLASRSNEWLKTSANADWVYAYDAWSVPIG
jgi:salicylate hydroxylase